MSLGNGGHVNYCCIRGPTKDLLNSLQNDFELGQPVLFLLIHGSSVWQENKKPGVRVTEVSKMLCDIYYFLLLNISKHNANLSFNEWMSVLICVWYILMPWPGSNNRISANKVRKLSKSKIRRKRWEKRLKSHGNSILRLWMN